MSDTCKSEGYDCQKIKIQITNFNTGADTNSANYTVFKSVNRSSVNVPLSDTVISDARKELCYLLEELQEGLVVKLLLPTEPTTPTAMNDFASTLDHVKYDYTMKPFSTSASTSTSTSLFQQGNLGPENRPLLQRFKKLFNYTDLAGYTDQNSPDTVTHITDVCSPVLKERTDSRDIHTYNLMDTFDVQYSLPQVIIGPYAFDDYTVGGVNLQPISPICSREDVTSVQLLNLRILLDPQTDPPLRFPAKSDASSETFGITLMVDYAIRMQENEISKFHCDNACGDKNYSHLFGSVKIASMTHLLERSFDEVLRVDCSDISTDQTLSATITEIAMEIGVSHAKYELIIQLDFDYILNKLMQTVGAALRKISL